MLDFDVGLAGVGGDAAAQGQEFGTVRLQVAAAHEDDGTEGASLIDLQFDGAAAATRGGCIGLHCEAGERCRPRGTSGESDVLDGEEAVAGHAKTERAGVDQQAAGVLGHLHLLLRLRRGVGGNAKSDGFGEVAGKVGLEVDQQPLDAAVGPVCQGTLLGWQRCAAVFDDNMGGAGQFSLGEGYAEGDRLGGAVILGELLEVEGAHFDSSPWHCLESKLPGSVQGGCAGLGSRTDG